MGGRGARFGVSDRGNPYGSQYRTLFEEGNIKFVEAREGAEEQLLETRTKGRVYAFVGKEGIKSIIYFGDDLKRVKRIDLDHKHKGLDIHVEHGYYNNEYDIAAGVKKGATRPTTEEKRMVDLVRRLWDNYKRSR